MIRTQFASALALAAFLAVPAFAQSTSSSAPTQADVSKGTQSVNGAYVAPLDKAAAKQQAAAPHQQAKADSTTTSSTSTQADLSTGTKSVDGAYVAPLEKSSAKQQAAADCASHPQAGKLADKSTGEAKEHSASPVHSDCMTNAQTAKNKKKSAKTASSK